MATVVQDRLFIDLTNENAGEYVPTPKKTSIRRRLSVISLHTDDEDAIPAADTTLRPDPNPTPKGKGKGPYNAETIIISSDEDDSDVEFPTTLLPFAMRKPTTNAQASSSKLHSVEDDEALARKIAQEENRDGSATIPQFSPEDEDMARRLAEEEEKQFNELIQSIDSREDGIVFSIAVNAVDNTLEDGTPAHPDDLDRFQPWKDLFDRTSGGLKIKKFHWFVNYELEKRFEQARENLWKIMGERPEELQLFHGTNAGNIDPILKGGFKIGGVNGHPQSHGAASGYGIYLARRASTSCAYTAGTGNRIFACRVLPGRMTGQPMHYPPTSLIPGQEAHESYSGAGVYVVRYSCLVLPCYMIEFEPTYNYNAAGAWGFSLLPVLLPPPLVAPLPIVAPPPPPRRTRTTRTARTAKPKPKKPTTTRPRAQRTKAVADPSGTTNAPRRTTRSGKARQTAEDDEDDH